MRSVFVVSVLLALAGQGRAQGSQEAPWALRRHELARATRFVRTQLVERDGERWLVEETEEIDGRGHVTREPTRTIRVADAPAEADPGVEETLRLGDAALPCVRRSRALPKGGRCVEWRSDLVLGGVVRARATDAQGDIATPLVDLCDWGPRPTPRPQALPAAPGQWTLHRETVRHLAWRKEPESEYSRVWVRRWVEERQGELWLFAQEVDGRGRPLDEARPRRLDDPHDLPVRASSRTGPSAREAPALPVTRTVKGRGVACHRAVEEELLGSLARTTWRSDEVPLGGLVEVDDPFDGEGEVTLVAWGLDGPRSSDAPLALREVEYDLGDLVRHVGADTILRLFSREILGQGGEVTFDGARARVRETTKGHARAAAFARWCLDPP